jgi:cytochrome P450 family 6
MYWLHGEKQFLKQLCFFILGMRFGLMQTKVGLVSLLSAYEFSVCNKTAIPLKKDPMQFNNVPLGGIWLQIKKRMNKSV